MEPIKLTPEEVQAARDLQFAVEMAASELGLAKAAFVTAQARSDAGLTALCHKYGRQTNHIVDLVAGELRPRPAPESRE